MVFNFFLRNSSSWVSFLESYLCPEVGQCSQGAFAFPRAPGTQESFEFAALFGTSIPIWSLKLDPESTCLRDFLFHMHVLIPQTSMPNTSQVLSSVCVTGI